MALLDGSLIVSGIPYLRRDGRVADGDLVVPLAVEGDRLAAPSTHTAWWSGQPPHEADGTPMRALNVAAHEAAPRHRGLPALAMMCCKPHGREFRDHREFVLTYLAVLGGPVAEADPSISMRRRRRSSPVALSTGPFAYRDTASSRARLGAVNAKLAGLNVGIVGLGGTGSYVLDLVAKSGVGAIHLFDDDVFEQHSAFRAPGAATIDDLRLRRSKVEHFADAYRAIHRAVIAHRVRIDARTAPLLDVLDFAFVCIDAAAAKPPIMERLAARGISWVDAGMGLHATEHGIAGAVRTTLVTPVDASMLDRIPVIGDPDGVYATNIQICELNALNASLAVVAWKRHQGFYAARVTGCVDWRAITAMRYGYSALTTSSSSSYSPVAPMTRRRRKRDQSDRVVVPDGDTCCEGRFVSAVRLASSQRRVRTT